MHGEAGNLSPPTKPKRGRGWVLRNGNTPGDPSTAPRCGARTRRGTPCQCPAIRGRRRCRLHGGRSTGPRTAAGLARIRAANMRSGRYSKEHLALERRLNAFQRNGVRSARQLPDGPARAHYEAVAWAERCPPKIAAQMQAEVRAELARAERERLEMLNTV